MSMKQPNPLSFRWVFVAASVSFIPLLQASSASENLDDAIRQHRMGTLIIQTAPGATVQVEQQRHEFWFGAALANQAFNGTMNQEDAARYRAVFLENFNSAVTENALKWAVMEPRRGQINYAVVDAMLAWTAKHDIPLRGHNIFWGIEKFVPEWLKALGDEELHKALELRARSVARRYRGRFAEYDLNNEMIHGNYFADRLGPGITGEMARWVKDEDPTAVLYLNDYDTLTGRRTADYVQQIKTLLAERVPIDGIGVQGHLHGQTFDPRILRQSLDQLAQFGLPIRITEFNFPGQRSKFYENPTLPITPEEEIEKARALTEYYRICFAHPAVRGILMWGFWEGANWIPQSSLYRRDWTPTPAAEAYRELIFNTWWTRAETQADASGRLEVPAFYGEHRITANGESKVVLLRKEDGQLRVDLR